LAAVGVRALQSHHTAFVRGYGRSREITDTNRLRGMRLGDDGSQTEIKELSVAPTHEQVDAERE
jgi:phage head maturation protease